MSGKGSRKFYVTAKDATVLGRISHKAVAKRSTRVMEPHEVCWIAAADKIYSSCCS